MAHISVEEDDAMADRPGGGSARTCFAILRQGDAHIVDKTLFMVWHATYPIITWTWDSCGGAQCRGVLSGKELPRTALTICARACAENRSD